MVAASERADLACAVLSFDNWRPKRRTGRARSVRSRSRLDNDGYRPVLRLSSPDELPDAHQFARAFKPTLVHVHHGMLWPFADQIRSSLAVPAVFQVHVLQQAQNRLRHIERITLSMTTQARALAEADAIVAPSKTSARALARDAPESAPRTHVVGLGIDDSAHARGAAHARSRRGPILYAGRFADINGTAELFQAIPRVVAFVDDARFTIAGGIPENRKSEARWLKQWREHTTGDVHKRVEFIGWQSPAQLSRCYAEARMLISPSWLETFGLVVLEAMLHGLPIVGTRCGGVQELVEHGVTGLLAPPRDVDQLVAHTVAMCSDDARADAMGRAAASDVRTRRLWSHVVPQLKAVYHAVQRRCLDE